MLFSTDAANNQQQPTKQNEFFSVFSSSFKFDSDHERTYTFVSVIIYETRNLEANMYFPESRGPKHFYLPTFFYTSQVHRDQHIHSSLLFLALNKCVFFMQEQVDEDGTASLQIWPVTCMALKWMYLIFDRIFCVW